MFKRILLAYDGSGPARKAFVRSLELATRAGSALAFVTVIRAREFALDAGAQTALETACARCDDELVPLRRRASFAGVETTAMIGIGHPARQIVLAADEWHADLIVAGRRRRRSWVRWISRSVSSELLDRAHCAVLVVQ